MFYPNLIVIGAMKSGTSTLHDHLSLHPDIYASEIKELDYFLWNYSKGPDWYKSHFPEEKKYRLESSPNYTKFYKDWEYAAKKIHQDIPHCKLIYLVRNPTKRTLSQCRHHNLNPNKIIPKLLHEDRENEILTNSQYCFHIKEYLKYFEREQMLILKMEELAAKPEKALKKITSFLNIPVFFPERNIHSNNSFGYNHPTKIAKLIGRSSVLGPLKERLCSKCIKSSYRKIFYYRKKHIPASVEVRRLLDDYFLEDIERLELITDFSFMEWKK